jgi:dolichol-phosphate mannosyltransferase
MYSGGRLMGDLRGEAADGLLLAPGAKAAPELTVVVPTFNEVANVPILIERLRAVLSGVEWEVIFVDDNSPDGTAAAVRRIGHGDARVRCICRIGRRGLAGACVEGMLASQADYVAVIDSDLQHDETVLAGMLDKIKREQLDLVVASRYMDGPSAEGFGRTRARLSAWATRLASNLIGEALSDPMSGFFMVRRPVFEALAPKLSSQGFKILLDIVATAHGRLRMAELPYVFRGRQHGESKLDNQVALAYVTLLLAKATNDLLSMRFLSYCLIGASGIGVHMVVLLICLPVLGLSFNAAQITATVLAITSNFVFNNTVTYRDMRLRGLSLLTGWVKFTLICAIGAVSNVGIASLIYAHNSNWALSAGLAGAIVGGFWNFMVSAILVWRLR